MRKEEKAKNGQTIRTESGPDRSSFMQGDAEALSGRAFKGGPKDVSHSLSGAGGAVSYNDTPARKR